MIPNHDYEIMMQAAASVFRDKLALALAKTDNGTKRQKEILTAVEKQLGESVLKAAKEIFGQVRTPDIINQVTPAEVKVYNEVPMPLVTNRVESPEVKVFNKVDTPSVVVRVDTRPIAEALERANERIVAALASFTEGLASITTGLSKFTGALVKVNTAKTPIEFKPVVQIPETVVNVEAPNVTIEAPVERPKRRLLIKHDDGSKSMIIEE